MSEFVSWIEYEDEVYFLKDSDLNTKEGRAVYPRIKDDIYGHGAIKEYYSELKNKGTNKECTNFSSPGNFPKPIAEAIKAGKMSRIGFSLDLLNNNGKREYKKIEQPAWTEYLKIVQPARAEYRKIERQASAEYRKIEQRASAEYRKIEQQASAEYQKIEQPALAKYQKIKQPAWTEYQKIVQPAFWKIFSQNKYRVQCWCY